MKPSLCLLPLLLAAPAFCAADSALLELLPPDTQIVIGTHVRAVIDSPLAQAQARELNQVPEMQGVMANWPAIVAQVGFDPLHDVDEVILATNGQGRMPPVLVVSRGNFPVQKLSAGGEPYHGVMLMSMKGQSQGYYAFLDGNTALAGDADAVKAAIDRRGTAAGLPGALSEKIADYRERYEIWGIVNRTDGLTGYLPTQAGKSTPFDSIDRIQFGVGVRDGLTLAAEAHTRSAKDADQLTSTLQFFQSVALAQQPAGSGTKIDIKSNNGTIRLSLAVSAEDLRKAIEMRMKTLPPRAPGGFAQNGGFQPPPRVQSSAASAPAKPVTVPTTGASTSGGTAVFTLPGRQ